ncbi:hypothetical protein G3I56_41360, partial [Streptomyces sp. SID12488]|nr:hypothetical protein [Streptomyces sp. SID12488]
GARAGLPGRDAGGRPGAPGGAPRGPQGPGAPQQGGRPAPAGAGAGAFGGQAPGAPQGLQAAGGFGDSAGARQGQDAFGNNAGRQDGFGGSRGPVPPQRGEGQGQGGGRRPQLPPRGGGAPRPELPGGNAPSRPSWSDENAQPPVPRASLDTPRGHEEPDSTSRMPRLDDLQNPGVTSEFARPDFNAPRPGGPSDTGQFPLPGYNGSGDTNGQQNNGSYVRSDVFGTPPGGPQSPQNPQNNGQFTPSSYDNGSTGQFPAPTGYDSGSTGQFPAPSGFDGRGPVPGRPQNPSSTGQFERPQPGAGRGPADFGGARPPVPPRPPQPEALPPASGPGDGRTPLYDTLETNWFHGQGQQGQQPPSNGNGNGSSTNGNGSALSQPSSVPAPPRPAASPASTTGSWRTSPNDELVRQAAGVRQPAAGGVTTSGLPRRVPRANLVPGTAQQQQHQSGPAVSRAPDDVRGRLTNLRRGIAQGRQAGTGSDQTGSFPSPTHQQER